MCGCKGGARSRFPPAPERLGQDVLGASIIIPTYCPNDARYALCRRSFSELHQTGVARNKYEVIVVNNGGIHQDLIDEFDTDLVITNNRNIGQAAALNAGIGVALSDNLVLMDDDLSYREGWLMIGLKLLNRFPDHAISLQSAAKRYITGRTDGGHIYSRKVGGVWIMRRSLYDRVGRFGLAYFSFGGLWTRNLIRAGSRFVVSKRPYIFHLGEGRSIVGDNREAINDYRSPRPA